MDVVAENVGVCDDERVVYELFQPHLSIVGADKKWPIWYMAPGVVNVDLEAVKRHGASLPWSGTRDGAHPGPPP